MDEERAVTELIADYAAALREVKGALVPPMMKAGESTRARADKIEAKIARDVEAWLSGLYKRIAGAVEG